MISLSIYLSIHLSIYLCIYLFSLYILSIYNVGNDVDFVGGRVAGVDERLPDDHHFAGVHTGCIHGNAGRA